MARPVWKGRITFGLVNVPIALYPAEQREDLSFRLIDSRNSARVRYERVNEETGEEVPWGKIVKGYEYEDGNYVLFSESELDNASAELTRTIEIEQFVDVTDIDIRYFEAPYILVPTKDGAKGYVLLREAMRASGKAGIARVVLRARQHLASLVATDDALVLELLRFPNELRSPKEFELPGHDPRKYKVTKQEIDLAEKLIDGLSAEWDPSQFHDEFRDVLMKLVEKKVKQGETAAIDVEAPDADEKMPKTINFMDVLKKSVAKAGERSKKRSSSKARKTPERVRRSQSRKKQAV